MQIKNNWHERQAIMSHTERMGIMDAEELSQPVDDTQLVPQPLTGNDQPIAPTSREAAEEDREALIKAMAMQSLVEHIEAGRLIIPSLKFKPPQYERLETPNGTALDRQLGYPMRTVIVHNYTPQFAMIDAARYYVPPATVGIVLPVRVASQKAVVKWEAPPTITQPASATGALLISEWLEEELPFSPGIPLPFVLGSGPQVVPTANILDGTATANGVIITIPAGRQWIGSLEMSAALTQIASGAAIAGTLVVTVTGAGATPAPTTVVGELVLNTPTQVAGSTAQVADATTISNIVVIAASGAAATLTLTLTNLTAGSATAIGILT